MPLSPRQRELAYALPPPLQRAMKAARTRAHRWTPPRAFARAGRRTTPVRRNVYRRGTPIDRYYVEHFLRRWNDPLLGRAEMRGAVMEFQDPDYATLIGRCHETGSPITRVEVVDLGDNPRATIRADITTEAPELADASFDTVICTQVLHIVFDLQAAIATLARVLRPGGVLYISVPGISQYHAVDRPEEPEYWRFTAASMRRLLAEHFRPEDVVVEAYGNLLASVAYLNGLAAEEFAAAKLDRRDPSFEMLIAARAIRTS